MPDYKKIIAQNKKANFEYFIEDRFEAGIVLVGSEVKSIRNGKVSLADSHVGASGNEGGGSDAGAVSVAKLGAGSYWIFTGDCSTT